MAWTYSLDSISTVCKLKFNLNISKEEYYSNLLKTQTNSLLSTSKAQNLLFTNLK